MAGSAELRRQLVEQLQSSGCLTSAAVRRALLAVPRERFLSDVAEREGLERVYRDEPIVTRHDARGLPASSSSQPSIMAAMLETLELRRGHRVLEIGAGTGYNAALLARIVGAGGKIVSVELDPATARAAQHALAELRSPAHVVRGDGREGWPREAPYDRVIVTASTAVVPRAWHEQLRDGGLLELPLVLDQAGMQMIVTLRRHGPELRSEALLHGGFMALRDPAGDAVPSAPPRVSAGEHVDGRSRSFAHLSGGALRGLSRARRRELLALALSEPRRRALGLRAPRPALELYLTIEAPADRFVGGWPRIGVMTATGDGLALLAGGPKTFTRVDAYGSAQAEELLLGLIDAWKTRGRPAASELQVRMSFTRQAESGVRLTWTSPSSAA